MSIETCSQESRHFSDERFKTEEGMKTFEVSVFEYNVVDVGMEGTLVFQGYQLLFFGDWIKEFSL